MRPATASASPDGRPAASRARLMKADSVAADMRGTSAGLAVLASAATGPDMVTPCCCCYHLTRIGWRLQQLRARGVRQEIARYFVDASDPAQRHAADELRLEVIEH